MIQHIVLFKLSMQGDDKIRQIEKIKTELEELPKVIDELRELHVRVNINPAEEYDFMLIAYLDHINDVASYAQHPKHQEILSCEIKPYLEKRACVDVMV